MTIDNLPLIIDFFSLCSVLYALCFFSERGRIYMTKLMIKNIGTLVSGNISNPILNVDTLIIDGGLIQAVGKEKTLDTKGVDQVMDVGGVTITPGLIDSHCPLVL